MNRVAIVTGASGILGSRLCIRLREQGWFVVGLSRGQAPAASRWLRCDLAAPAEDLVQRVRALVPEVQVVIHLAAMVHEHGKRSPASDYERINVGGTACMVSTARALGARRFILASSVKAMGEETVSEQDEDTPCRPASDYGRSKLRAEEAARSGAGEMGVVALRFSMIYGPGDKSNLSRWARLMKRRLVPPFPRVNNRRSLIYVDDAVAALERAADPALNCRGTFIINDGRYYSSREIYEAIRRGLGRRPMADPGWVWAWRGAALAGEIARRLCGRSPFDRDAYQKLFGSSQYSSLRAQRELGFRPQWSLEAGVAQLARELK